MLSSTGWCDGLMSLPRLIAAALITSLNMLRGSFCMPEQLPMVDCNLCEQEGHLVHEEALRLVQAPDSYNLPQN